MQHETAIPVGSGGMGEVFKAWDPDLQRHVALKYLRHDDPVMVERLLREARAQARVDHPSVCKVYEVAEEDGRPFIAMEYVDGVPSTSPPNSPSNRRSFWSGKSSRRYRPPTRRV